MATINQHVALDFSQDKIKKNENTIKSLFFSRRLRRLYRHPAGTPTVVVEAVVAKDTEPMADAEPDSPFTIGIS